MNKADEIMLVFTTVGEAVDAASVLLSAVGELLNVHRLSAGNGVHVGLVIEGESSYTKCDIPFNK